jgi:hypothetical protein
MDQDGVGDGSRLQVPSVAEFLFVGTGPASRAKPLLWLWSSLRLCRRCRSEPSKQVFVVVVVSIAVVCPQVDHRFRVGRHDLLSPRKRAPPTTVTLLRAIT